MDLCGLVYACQTFSTEEAAPHPPYHPDFLRFHPMLVLRTSGAWGAWTIMLQRRSALQGGGTEAGEEGVCG